MIFFCLKLLDNMLKSLSISYVKVGFTSDEKHREEMKKLAKRFSEEVW